MAYVELEHDFDKEFDTYVIAYCVDINSWFITNQRGWFFQFDEEFNSYDEALKFFEDNQEMILNKQNEILVNCGQKPTSKIWLQKQYE